MGYERCQGDSDETLIRLDHDAKIAEVWTMKKGIVSKLKRVGASFQDRQGPGLWATLPIKSISFRKPVKRGHFQPNTAGLRGPRP